MVSGILSKIVARFRSPEPPPRNWFYGSAAAILLLAAVLRLLRRFLEPFPVRDGIWYVQMAQEIAGSSWREAVSADAGGLLEFYPPLIFAVMAGGEHCGLGAENAGWVLVLTTGCLLPVAIALIARELFGDWRYTLGALLLASIMPPAVLLWICSVVRHPGSSEKRMVELGVVRIIRFSCHPDPTGGGGAVGGISDFSGVLGLAERQPA